MREIKFRAWYTPFKGKKYGQKMKYGRAGALLSFAEMNPDDYILMQYTGLKDKNGVEVYFGDALTNGDMTRTVIWREEDSQIQLSVNDNNYETRIKLTQQLINIFGLSVCGNIYENPELLKESGASE